VGLPHETYQEWVQKAQDLQEQTWSKTFYAAFTAGCYVGMAALLALVIGGNETANPVFQKLLYAALFPVSMLLITQSGAQLFTGNSAIMAIGKLEGRVTLKGLLRNWGVTYLGNLCGCLAMTGVALYTGLLAGGAGSMAAQMVIPKCSETFGQAVVNGAMCNWLLCAAVWLGTMARGMSGKMVGFWFPISMFVGIGFEHSISNMFMLSAGLASGAPSTLATVFWKNLIPVTIGNVLAGAVIVGGGMSYAFGRLGRIRKHEAVAQESKTQVTGIAGSLVKN